MKKCLIMFFAVAALCLQSIATPPDFSKAAECGARMTAVADFPLKAEKSDDTKVNSYFYDKKGIKTYVVNAERFNKNPNEWETLEFSFTPSQSGTIRFCFSAVQGRDKNGNHRKLAVYYDNLKIDGKLFYNGDFEKGINGFSTIRNQEPRIEHDPDFVKFGKSCLRAWFITFTSSPLKVEKGVPVKISVMTKPAGEIAIDDDAFLDFSPVAKDSSVPAPKLPKDKNGEFVVDGLRFKVGDKTAVYKNKFVIDLKGKHAAGKYVYLLHYAKNLSPKKNPDYGRVMAMDSNGVKLYSMLLGGRSLLDTDAYRPEKNARAVWFSDPQKKTGALYLSRFDLPSDMPIDSVLFNKWFSGEWHIVAATISDKKIFPFEMWKPSADKWSVADTPADDRVKKGTALDLASFFHDGEAGCFGRVKVSKRGTYTFEKKPNDDVRFKSFVLNVEPTFRLYKGELRKEALKEFAEDIKRTGYNCVRIDFDFVRNPRVQKNLAENMDDLDYLMAELKKNGVYIHYVLGWRDFGLDDSEHPYMRDEMKMRCVFCDPEVLAAWKKWIEYHLNHVNPYTKLALKDDPQIVQVEYFNELSITLSRIGRMPKPVADRVKNIFRNYLKDKYGNDIEKLNDAWESKLFSGQVKPKKYKSFDDIEKFHPKNLDWLECALANKRKYFDFCTEVVRGTGYRGIIASENIGGSPAQSDIQNGIFDSTIVNTYFDHPINLLTAGATPENTQTSNIGSAFANISSLAVRHFCDRPAGITEYNHPFWNKYRYEIAATFPPYCAYQNFSMITLHDSAVPNRAYCEKKAYRPLPCFTACHSQVLRASEILATCFFVRGDVKPAKANIYLKIPADFGKTNHIEYLRAFNIAQTRLALVAGLRIECVGEKPEAVRGVDAPRPALELAPFGFSNTNTDDWFQNVVADKNSANFDTAAAVAQLRKSGALPPDNITDVDNGVFETDTKQILLDAKKRIVKIITPKSELVATESGESAELGALKLVSSTIPASVGVCSLDNAEIAQSSKLLFFYITQEVNTGMELSYDMKMLAKRGTAPILLQTGNVRAELKLDPTKTYSVYPLSLTGERRAEIPAKYENGALKIDIDTSKLPDGATCIFEIAAK